MAIAVALTLAFAPSALAAPAGYGPSAAPRYDASGPGKSTTASASAASSVSIIDYAFTPGQITVNAGDTVTWTNSGTDANGHTVTGSGLNSALLHTGNAYSFTFTRPGTFSYACSVHPNMKGSVTVLAKATTPSKGNHAKGGGPAGPGSSSKAPTPSQGSPASAATPPAAPSGSESAAVDSAGAAGSQASLPSTGSETFVLLAVGLALLGSGLVMRTRGGQA